MTSSDLPLITSHWEWFIKIHDAILIDLSWHLHYKFWHHEVPDMSFTTTPLKRHASDFLQAHTPPRISLLVPSAPASLLPAPQATTLPLPHLKSFKVSKLGGEYERGGSILVVKSIVIACFSGRASGGAVWSHVPSDDGQSGGTPFAKPIVCV